MPKNTAFNLSDNILWILAVLASLSLVSCDMKALINTKPWTQDQKEISSHNQTDDGINSVIYSPDGKTFITGCASNKILVWDAQTGDLLKSSKTIYPEMSPTPNYVIPSWFFLSPDCTTAVNIIDYPPCGRMQIWDAHEGKLLHTLMGHEHWIKAVAFSPDSKIMASGGFDIVILLWDLQTGKSLGILEEIDCVQSLAFSPDGKILAAGNSIDVSAKKINGAINLWDMQTREILHTLSGHERATECLAFSTDGRILASGGWDGTMRFWDVQTGEQLKVLTDKDTGGPVLSIAFSPDGKTLATGGWDCSVRLWDAETGVMWRKIRPLGLFSKFMVRSVVFSPDGETLTAGVSEGTILMWNVKTGKRLKTLRSNPFPTSTSPAKANK
jgi:WD40 repeat protein